MKVQSLPIYGQLIMSIEIGNSIFDDNILNISKLLNISELKIRFYLLPKIHKRLNNVPGRLVISNCGYYTENISAFLDFHLQPLAQAVKSYIKDRNDFLNKLRSLPELPDNIILCTVDVVGLYPNISLEEGLSALRKRLDNRMEKYISSDTLCNLAEVVLKNNIFKFGKKH